MSNNIFNPCFQILNGGHLKYSNSNSKKTSNYGKLLHKIKVLVVCMQNPTTLFYLNWKTNNKVLPNFVFTVEFNAFEILAGRFE